MQVTSSDVDEILYGDSHQCPNLAAYIAEGKKLGKGALGSVRLMAPPSQECCCAHACDVGASGTTLYVYSTSVYICGWAYGFCQP